LKFILESLRAYRCLAYVVPPPVCASLLSPPRVWRRSARGEALGRRSPRVCGFARRPRGCGVAQHVARPWGDGPPVCVALLVAPWCELASGRCTVARPPHVRRHVLYLFNVAWQEAEGEVGAYFSPWLRTRAQAQEVRPGQLADKAVDESEWTSWSSGWRIGPRNELIQPCREG
jgi:hypothetical protein